MKVATIDNVKVGDEVWIKSKVINIEDGSLFPIEIAYGEEYTIDGRYDLNEEPSLFIAEPEFKPREMKVWDDVKSDASIKMVVGVYKGQYVVEYTDGTYTTFKKACDLPEKKIKMSIPESKLEAVKKLLAE